MYNFNLLGVLTATMGAFIISGIWYAAFSGALQKLHKAYTSDKKMSALDTALELSRSFVVAVAVAFLINQVGVNGLGNAFLYAIVLWLAFPVVLLAGSVLHEKVPSKLAAIHAGDWLVKLLFVTSLLTLWK